MHMHKHGVYKSHNTNSIIMKDILGSQSSKCQKLQFSGFGKRSSDWLHGLSGYSLPIFDHICTLIVNRFYCS